MDDYDDDEDQPLQFGQCIIYLDEEELDRFTGLLDQYGLPILYEEEEVPYVPIGFHYYKPKEN